MPISGPEVVRVIDQAIDRLIRAFDEADLPPIGPARDGVNETLDRISAQIAPLRLPPDLETFWRRVDPGSIALAPYPRPTSPAFALEAWLDHEDGQRMTPRLLFPLAYESHGFLFIELDDQSEQGGAVFGWAYGGDPFMLRHVDLAAYLDLLAMMIELGEFSREPLPGGEDWYAFDPENHWYDAVAARLATAPPLPGHGGRREYEDDLRDWPEHWLRASDLVDGDQGAG